MYLAAIADSQPPQTAAMSQVIVLLTMISESRLLVFDLRMSEVINGGCIVHGCSIRRT
jgi:hypothetical protein